MFPADQIPTFRLQARVISIDDVAPASTKQFSMQLENWQFAPCVGPVHSVGTQLSDPLVADSAAIAVSASRDPNNYSNKPPLAIVLSITPNGAKRMRVAVTVTFDEAPNAPVLIDDIPLGREFYYGNPVFSGVLLYVYRDANGAPVVQRSRDYNRDHYWAPNANLALAPEDRPGLDMIFTDCVLRLGDETDAIEEAVAAFTSWGINTPMIPPSPEYRDGAVRQGAPHVRIAEAIILNSYDDIGIADPTTALNAWAKRFYGKYIEAGYSPTDIVLIAVEDEGGAYNPKMLQRANSDPATLARFQAFLRGDFANQCGPKAGATPADFGAFTDWGQIHLVGRGYVKTGTEPVTACRLYLRSIEFLSWDMCYFRLESQKATNAFLGVADAPTAGNANNFQGRFTSPSAGANNTMPNDQDSSFVSHDPYVLSRMKACGYLFTEDWLYDPQAEFVSFDGSRMRSAAEIGGRKWGMYQIPMRPNLRETGLQQKVLSAVAHGASAVEHYRFGPRTLNSQESWSDYPDIYHRVIASHKLIAPAVPYMKDRKWAGAGVSVVAPRYAYAWDLRTQAPNLATPVGDPGSYSPALYSMDYIEERFGIWLAMAHGGVPMHHPDETALNLAGLIDQKIVFLTPPNLSADGMSGLLDWVEAGGVLMLSPGAGRKDEFDQPLTMLADRAGVGGGPRTAVYTHQDANTSLGVVPATPDWAVTAFGKGKILQTSFWPGIAYWRSKSATQDGLPTGFSPSLGTLIRMPISDLGIVLPAKSGSPMVEVVTWTNPLGTSVYCINWSGAPIPGFKLTLSDATLNRAALASKGAVSMQGSTVTFDLGIVGDIVLLNRVNVPPPVSTADQFKQAFLATFAPAVQAAVSQALDAALVKLNL
jgi:hypothetical protein